MDNINIERFSELLQRYLAQDLDGEELTEFFEAAHLPQYQQLLADAVMRDLQEKTYRGLAAKVREENLWSALQDKAGFNVDPLPETPVKRINFINWQNRAAAVLILCLVSAAVYFFTHQSDYRQIAVETKSIQNKKPLSPGKEGAVLTLADGRNILLDEEQNGSVANQAGTDIIKNKGALTYSNAVAPKEILFNTMTTPKGRQYMVVLADGTKVWLNAASSIRFPTAFTSSERRVEITGEAYLEVAHNAAKPFKVSLDGGEVEVLGTRFNVNAYKDEETVKTTLLEGSVRYQAGTRGVVIHPAEQVVAGRINNSLRVEHNVDLEATVAWKEGRFMFNRMPIEMIMRQIARWYDVEIEYNGTVTKELFSGDVSRQEEVSQLLDILAATKAVSFSINNSKIIVTSK